MGSAPRGVKRGRWSASLGVTNLQMPCGSAGGMGADGFEPPTILCVRQALYR